MRACYIDVQNHVVKEYAMTWENVSDTFLNENSCFKNSVIQNMKKERYLLLFTCVCTGRQIWLLYRIAYATTSTTFHPHPAWHDNPFSHPNQFGVIIHMHLGWMKWPCFNNDKQDEWQSSIPIMSLFPLRSFWEHFLHEARSLGSVD